MMMNIQSVCTCIHICKYDQIWTYLSVTRFQEWNLAHTHKHTVEYYTPNNGKQSNIWSHVDAGDLSKRGYSQLTIGTPHPWCRVKNRASCTALHLPSKKWQHTHTQLGEWECRFGPKHNLLNQITLKYLGHQGYKMWEIRLSFR